MVEKLNYRLFKNANSSNNCFFSERGKVKLPRVRRGSNSGLDWPT